MITSRYNTEAYPGSPYRDIDPTRDGGGGDANPKFWQNVVKLREKFLVRWGGGAGVSDNTM